MQLRAYQREAVDAVYRYLREHDDNPVIVIPTAGGKTPIAATICRDAVTQWQGRVIILAHVKELLEQAFDKLDRIAPELRVGVYSAGFGRRDTQHPVILAGIQSVYKRACDLGPFDLILVDEAHCIAPEGNGMYRQFLAEMKVVNPRVRVIGLTATPFRMKSGMICAPEDFLNAVCYEVGVRQLIVDGYLCKLVTKAGCQKPDTSGLHVRAGEFVANETEALMDQDALVDSACAEIAEYTRERHSCLVFASGVKHGEHLSEVLRAKTRAEVGTVFGNTIAFNRARMLDDFRKGKLKYLVNVNVLTTGFDAPNIDCVSLVRPTMSPGLYYQMCLDMETEVLTRSGWRRCHEVTTGDEVAAFDMETEEIVYVRALDKVHRALRSHESMYGVCAPHLDIRVTDQHNLVVRSKSHSTRNWRLQPACEAASRRDSYMIPVAGAGKRHGSDMPLSDAEVSFLGWFLTDGYRSRTNNTVAIAQSLAKHHEEVRSVLQACAFGFREYHLARRGRLSQYKDGLLFVIPNGVPRGINNGKRGWAHLTDWLDKDVPAVYDKLSVKQFRILLAAMNRANGSHRARLTYCPRVMSIAVGCRRRLADRIQQLGIERGFRCNVVEYAPRTSSWNAHPQRQWMLHVKEQRVAYIGGMATRPSRMVPNRCCLGSVPYQTNEWVWCLTTEKGTLVTRRRGKVAIVGNCGRGFRLHPGKQDCLVLDFGGNVLRHGPVDQVKPPSARNGTGEAPAKECPQCHSVIAAGYATCPDCGYVFPPPERQKHEGTASTAGILSGEVTTNEYLVKDVIYSVHTKKGAPPEHPKTLRVDYEIGINWFISEWVCPEHTGYARWKFEKWWRTRSYAAPPNTAEEAAALAQEGALAPTTGIKCRHVAGEQHEQVVGHVLGPKPRMAGWDDEPVAQAPVAAAMGVKDEDIPF